MANDELATKIANIIASLVLGDVNQQSKACTDIVSLMEAIQAQDPDLANYLVKNVVDPNQRLPTGEYPSHVATQLRTNACAMLIALQSSQKYPLNLNVQDSKGDTILHVAARLNNPDAVNLLLKSNADPNIQNMVGDTPLHIACKVKAPQIARKLLADRRTDPTKKNKEGKAANQVTELAEILVEFMEHGLKRENAQCGVLEISLAWSNYNDLDLHVICPHNEEIMFNHKLSACKGGLDVDMNAGGAKSEQPVEHIRWTESPPTGEYKVYVNHYAMHTNVNETTFLVVIQINKNKVWEYQGKVSSGQKMLVKTFSYPWR
ncbi:unnamed protein product [Rotaria socialis]|uniref:Uncharacterized protein n=1 Tax=Rotaria socialis TaxID=392032 RepID=A0A821PDX1_9BILA|nr:unnamed protein product [Rotaria socialis]CAF3494315.1 unnamed protein product [Rotaria socialis]CAF4655090.1 unnamed protein product [Rotaria socialis]CAF4805823.1 unnamed protein product [Rotaria socialis]